MRKLIENGIKVKGLSHFYGKKPILKDISFSIDRGEFFIIIGSNGSGKTTLMKIISGLEKLQNGTVKILGKSIGSYNRRSLAKKTAIVPQSIPSDFPFKVNEVVMFGRSPHLGLLGIEGEQDFEHVSQALKFTGIRHLENRRLNQLSGGERQMVYIARAICQDPQIILLDEPTASLDLAHQVQVMDLMEKLKNEMGTTIVMVSHDVNLAGMYADQLLLLKEGTIVSTGTPTDVLTFKTLEKAYGCTLLVNESPLGEFPQVTLVPKKVLNRLNKEKDNLL